MYDQYSSGIFCYSTLDGTVFREDFLLSLHIQTANGNLALSGMFVVVCFRFVNVALFVSCNILLDVATTTSNLLISKSYPRGQSGSVVNGTSVPGEWKFGKEVDE